MRPVDLPTFPAFKWDQHFWLTSAKLPAWSGYQVLVGIHSGSAFPFSFNSSATRLDRSDWPKFLLVSLLTRHFRLFLSLAQHLKRLVHKFLQLAELSGAA